MPYDPATGKWKDEDLSVSNRLTGLMSKDNPYMKQAETEGLKQANRRGLANSSMAVTAVEDSRIRSALPIASQESSQANSRYLNDRGIQASDLQQGRGIESQERMQLRGLEHETGLQERDIGSRERLTREGFAHESSLQSNDIDQRRWLAQFDAETQQRMQAFDANVRQLMQGLDLESQERIASMNVSASERNQAAGLAASFEQSYAAVIAAIANNPDLPAGVRQSYLNHANEVRNSQLALVEQMYGIDLEWETPGAPAGSGSQPAQLPEPFPADDVQPVPDAGPGLGLSASEISDLEARGFLVYWPDRRAFVNPSNGQQLPLSEVRPQ